ncbi:D-alanyl-D-alanine carboxypeptidase family protein [Sphingomonas echinoides]|uniref:D-alanyl-D-alanine carboxypeptidase family protein n=1 Tax=Sphingomonas echinoides TaxID=59803 RepID=UPI0024131075|nr:D-alanyl-D-alanine carboxypeptidase family protein [Sphingomonas echinoides]
MADQTERLLLQVDAATELLRRSLADGEKPLDRFEKRAAKMAENVEGSIGSMGKRFGAFADLAQDAATKAERSFEASFSNVQKLAAKAIIAPTVTGGLNIGAADARAAAAAAQQQAIATRLIADASERAAQGEGVLTEQTRLYVQAARAAALESERHAQELNREAGALERVEIELQQAGAASRLFGEGQKKVSAQSGAQRAAMAGLSYQIQDTFTQLSMGANAFQVIAIQGGQAAGQFQNVEGKAGSFAKFMVGPYGLAITGALLILGPLTKGMFEFGDATDDAVEKLTKDATETANSARAKEIFGKTLEGVTAAIHEQEEALRKSADAEKSAALRAYDNATAQRQHAQDIRKATVALLEQAIAQEGIDRQRSAAPGQRGELGTLALDQSSNRVAGLSAQLSKANAALAASNRDVNVANVDLLAERAATAIDPIKSVTKLYDDRIRALKNQQREEAKLGKQVGDAAYQRLKQLETEKKAAIDVAQARQRASTVKPNNNQIGREVSVAEATSIVAGIGGRVTSGLRSTERQARLYADKLAGRHAGPVAKPGTSDHERGQAVDVAYGPGISVSSIRQAFAKEGVAIRQLIDERDQKVFHVAFGKKGTSQQTVDDRAERARQKVLSDDISYGQEEQAARQRLTAATRKSAQTEEQRDAELVASINADADSRKQKIDLQQEKGLSKARADNLRSLSEQTRVQDLQNAAADRAMRVIERRYDVDRQSLESRVALLRISEDMAPTERERARIAEQILEAEQTLRRQALERVRDTSKDPEAVMSAQRSLGALPALEGAERGQLARQNASPLDAYRERLKSATNDTKQALQGVTVDALGSLENSLAQSIGKVIKLKGAFGEMASSIVADLARIAIQKVILGALPGVGKFLGFSNGGSLNSIPGRADGGSLGGLISGPGNGRSDSILALLSGPGGGAVRLSNREFIMNEGAVNHYGANAMAAINARRLPRFANGGSLGGSPSLPSLRAPRLPAAAYGAGANRRMQLDGNITVSPSPEFDAKIEGVTLRTIGATAEPIMAGATARTMRKLNRGDLPGGFD